MGYWEELRKAEENINRFGKLLPCPFCGGKAHFGQAEATMYHIECNNCGCSSRLARIPSYWNKKHHYLYRVYTRLEKIWNNRTSNKG